MNKLFVIVLNYNGGKEILACLWALYLIKVPKNWQVEVLVVDNRSTDGSVTEIETRYKDITILRNKKNLGFAAGNNVGIRYALNHEAQGVLLLNQDTEVKKDFLIPLSGNPADVVGPIIKFKHQGNWVYDFGGRINWWLGRSYHMASPAKRGQPATIRGGGGIDYVSGCAMLIKKPVLEKVGLLDERFFLYFEDVDFCLRAKKAGFKIAVEPKSVILHRLKETKKRPLKQRLSLLASNLIFINRWILWCHRPIAYFYWLVLVIKILLK